MAYPTALFNFGAVHVIGTWWDDLRVDAFQTRTAANAPDIVGGFAGEALAYYVAFKAAGGEFGYVQIQLPHGYKQGSDIFPHVHFSPTTTGTGACQFDLLYSWANYSGTFGAYDTFEMTDTWATADQWGHRICKNSAGISGEGKTVSSVLQCRLTRNAAVASNYAADVGMLYFDIHYQLDAPGSRIAYIK